MVPSGSTCPALLDRRVFLGDMNVRAPIGALLGVRMPALDGRFQVMD